MAQNSSSPPSCDIEEQNAQINQNEANLAKTEKYEIILRNNVAKIAQLENDLKQKDNEALEYKKRISLLEEELNEAQKFKAQHLKESEEVEALKVKSEDTLTRAKSIIFDKTKVIKNQELQIEALNQQISSLKDVVSITKDLLEIRNLEIKQLETKIQCMEDRVGAEKERHDLMHKKLEHMIRYNGDLKREYETQLCLFSALRERYNERELAKGVVSDLQAASTSAVNLTSTTTSTIGTTSTTTSAVSTASRTTSAENATSPTTSAENATSPTTSAENAISTTASEVNATSTNEVNGSTEQSDVQKTDEKNEN